LGDEPRTWPALEIQQANADTLDLIQAFLTDFDVAAIDDNVPELPLVFFHDPSERDRVAEALTEAFPNLVVRRKDVPDEDWAARSQASLRAITVGALTIAPPWDIPDRIPNPESRIPDSVIVIQPSMGFGTGHHATTRLCLAALQELDLTGLSVIDVGTGSGVLAIAARRLGASGVLAIDDDADAIAAAEENVALNHESRIALEVGDFRAAKISQFDVVIANLTGGLLLASAERLQSFSVPGGRLVLSGLMESEEQDVLRAFEAFALDSRTQEDEWVCLILVRPGR
jgi:ribosomal protein L11 methyltransferase